jgi:hypothetical protein
VAGLRIEADDYQRFFTATKAMSGRLRSQIRKRVRDSGRRYGPDIVAEGAEGLPHRGGLSAHVAAKGRNPTVGLTSTGARLMLGKKKGPQIGRMNSGQLRHPVFYVWWKKGETAVLSVPGDRKTWKWVQQDITPDTFTQAAEKRLPEIRDDVAAEVRAVLRELG